MKMTKAQALKAARAKWGAEAFVRNDTRYLWNGALVAVEV